MLVSVDQLPNCFAWQGMLLLVSRWQEPCLSWPPTGFKLKREREREISNQNIGKPSLQSLHERHKDSCTHCSLGGSWQKPWLGDLWAGDLCSRGWTLQGSAIAMKCFKFPQFCILQCLTARSWLPTSNLLRALRPCWYNGFEPVGTGKTVRLSQKSFEIWYFNIRLKIS